MPTKALGLWSARRDGRGNRSLVKRVDAAFQAGGQSTDIGDLGRAGDGAVETAGDTNSPSLEALLSPHARRGGARRPPCRVPLGLFGVGPFVTNALSSRLTAEVRREGVRWVQTYTRGVALIPPTAVGPTTTSGTDERSPGGRRSMRYRFPGGARDFVAFLDARTGAP